MGLFKLGKKDKVLDLTERYRRQQERASEIKKEVIQPKEEASEFSFLGNLAESSTYPESEDSSQEEKRRKFAKRLVDMTSKIEDLSNQIYHLQQRVELLERKSKTGTY